MRPRVGCETCSGVTAVAMVMKRIVNTSALQRGLVRSCSFRPRDITCKTTPPPQKPSGADATAMEEVNERLAAQKSVQLEMGIGIHTGRVIVGNIGSLRRTKHAAVGSNVNLAARVESFTTGGQVLITEDTRASRRPLRSSRHGGRTGPLREDIRLNLASTILC